MKIGKLAVLRILSPAEMLSRYRDSICFVNRRESIKDESA
jgi:hypothetical protein